MSRGSKVFYVVSVDIADQASTNTSINNYITANYGGMSGQKGDIAVDILTNAASALTTDSSLHITARQIYQLDDTNWIALNNREVTWTDPNLIGNVTKIRKAHTEEIRSFINYVNRVYGRRYGDTWFNTHNLSQAVLYWASENDYARMYMANYGTDTNYLTIECGDNVDDRIRFVNKSGTNPVTNILDIGGDLFRNYVAAEFEKNLIVKENFFVFLTSEFTGNVHMLSDLDVDGNIGADLNLTVGQDAIIGRDLSVSRNLVVNGTSVLTGNITAGADLSIVGLTTLAKGRDKGIQFGLNRKIVDFNDRDLEFYAQDALGVIRAFINGASDLKVNYGSGDMAVLNRGHEGHAPAAGGIDADKLDGKHLSEIITDMGQDFPSSPVAGVGYPIGNTYIARNEGTSKQSFLCPMSGSIRALWKVWISRASGTYGGGARIELNGVSVHAVDAITQTWAEGTAPLNTDDITVVKGDVLTFVVHAGANDGATGRCEFHSSTNTQFLIPIPHDYQAYIYN